MDNSEIARELMRLGVEWRPGMLSTGNVRMLAHGHDVMCPDDVRRDGWHVADGHGSGLVWFAADGHSDLDEPDLDDPATLALVELQVREWWRDRGCICWEHEEDMTREDAGHMYVAWQELRCGSRIRRHSWKRDKQAEALLAAARAAKGGGR